MGTATNTNRLQYFDVLVKSGNGYLYTYLQDSYDLLPLTGDIRYRLTQALDTFKSMYTTYSDIEIEDAIFKFGEKTMQFLGLSGTYANPMGYAHNTYIRTESFDPQLDN